MEDTVTVRAKISPCFGAGCVQEHWSTSTSEGRTSRHFVGATRHRWDHCGHSSRDHDSESDDIARLESTGGIFLWYPVCHQCVYRFTWQVQLSSPYTPKVLQTYLMGPGHYSTVTIMVIR
jgi:hypothetical protein